jgi:ankyrin repeat protein
MEVMRSIMFKHGAAKSKMVMSDEQGRELLFLAAWFGDHAIVKHVLNRGIGCDEKNQHGKTELVLSAEEEHDEFVCTLLRHGADPNMSCAYGKTPSWRPSRSGIAYLP